MTEPPIIIKGSEWILSPETAEGAPGAIYGAECMFCDATSGLVDDDARPIEVWAIEHTRTVPTHRQYLVTVQKHWRVDPNPERHALGAVLAVPEAATDDRHPGGRAHARPGPLRRVAAAARRLARRVRLLAGPLFLLAVVGSCGVTVWTAVTTS